MKKLNPTGGKDAKVMKCWMGSIRDVVTHRVVAKQLDIEINTVLPLFTSRCNQDARPDAEKPRTASKSIRIPR